jgi:type II secretory pathway component PulF
MKRRAPTKPDVAAPPLDEHGHEVNSIWQLLLFLAAVLCRLWIIVLIVWIAFVVLLALLTSSGYNLK